MFANNRLFAKILSANALFSVDKDRAIALIRENILRENGSILRICENFLPRKFPAIWYFSYYPVAITLLFSLLIIQAIIIMINQ